MRHTEGRKALLRHCVGGASLRASHRRRSRGECGMQNAPGILAGLRVLDLTTGGALLCGRLLVDLGADVIVVEPPHGNPARSHGPFWQNRVGLDTGLYWMAYSHGKRSITVDLNRDSGR